MSHWHDNLREDEIAIHGSDPTVDRLIERLADARGYVAHLSRLAKQKGFGSPHEAIRGQSLHSPITEKDMEWAKERVAEMEKSESYKRGEECRASAHQWTGPHDRGTRTPAFICSHCRSTSAAWQHTLGKAP